MLVPFMIVSLWATLPHLNLRLPPGNLFTFYSRQGYLWHYKCWKAVIGIAAAVHGEKNLF
jgi:hypothetical protein